MAPCPSSSATSLWSPCFDIRNVRALTPFEYPDPPLLIHGTKYASAAAFVAAARGYRGRGFEVLAVAGAPEGAQASDVEVSLGGACKRSRQLWGLGQTTSARAGGWRWPGWREGRGAAE